MFNVFNYQGKCRRTQSYPKTVLFAKILLKQQKHLSAIVSVCIISAGVNFTHVKTPRFSGERNVLGI